MRCVELTRTTLRRHLEPLLDLVVAQMRAIGANDDRKRLRRALVDAIHPHSPAHMFVLFDENRDLAGFCFANRGSGLESGGDYLWINQLHVRAGERGEGLGGELLACAIRWAREHGCVTVSAVTAEDNTAARELFRRVGFRESPWIWIDKQVTPVVGLDPGSSPG